MTVKVEAFLALEKSLTNRLQASLRALVSPLYGKVQEALDAKDYDEAERLVRSLRLADLYEGNKDYVAYLTTLAMLFGASRVTRNPGTSVVGLGFEKDTAFQLNQTFSQMVGPRAEAFLIEQGVQLIAQLRVVTKADTHDITNPTPNPKPQRILRDFQTFMDDAGRAYLDIASSLHTSRVSAFGFTAEALALDLKEYQINEQLDNRICSVCLLMHGKKFKVRDARAALEVVTRVSDPEELKLLQPWPKQTKKALAEMAALTPEELVGNNWHIPPFHPRCRGLLSRVGKVPALPTKAPDATASDAQGAAGLPAPANEPDYVTTVEDFKVLNLPPPSKVGVQNWNAKVKTPVVEVAATLLATTAEKLLVDAVKDKVRPGVRVTSSTEFVKVTAARKVKQTVMNQSVRFYGEGVTVTLTAIPSGLGLKEYLIGLYVLAQDSGATTLTVQAPGVDLATLGFVKGTGGWVLNLLDKDAMRTFLK